MTQPENMATQPENASSKPELPILSESLAPTPAVRQHQFRWLKKLNGMAGDQIPKELWLLVIDYFLFYGTISCAFLTPRSF